MSHLEFPKFIYGDAPSIRRSLKKEAKLWMKHWAETGVFPVPKLAAVSPGAVVVCVSVSDLRDDLPGWRLYMVEGLQHAIIDALAEQELNRFSSAFEMFVLQYSWGALSSTLSHAAPNSIAAVSRRLEAVLSFWEELSKLRYVDIQPGRPIDLSELMRDHFSELLAMWSTSPVGEVRVELSAAITAMMGASRGDVRERVLRRLRALALSNPRIQNKSLLTDPTWLSEAVSKLDRASFESLTGGYAGDLLGRLYLLDRSVQET